MNGQIYVLTSGGLNYLGGSAVDYPNGIYRLEDDDTWTLVADISAFNDDNPVSFPDAGPGGNPFAFEARGSEFIVSDGNYNRLLRATTAGDISILASFDNVVPTGLETDGGGPVPFRAPARPARGRRARRSRAWRRYGSTRPARGALQRG